MKALLAFTLWVVAVATLLAAREPEAPPDYGAVAPAVYHVGAVCE